ncbi:MAG: O-antigen ligase family protein [Bacilli bacterium]|nr:O-antigen ligase family protein [Bacilli bacterium]
MKKLDKTKLLYLFLILQPIIDLITSIMTRFVNFDITLGMITRALFLIILLIYTIFFNNSKYKRKTIIYFIIFFMFILLYFLTKPDIFKLDFLIKEVTNLFKYFYLPITSVCLLNCFDSLRIDKEKIGKIFVINVVVFSVLIIIPELTNTSFSSYYGSNSGSVGWFFAANEVGAILTLLFPYIYKLGHQNRLVKLLICAIFIIVAMMIIGTKTAFFGMILTEIVFCIYFLIIRKKITIKPFLIALLILIISTVLIPSLPATNNMKNHIDRLTEEENVTDVEEEDNYEDKQNTLFGRILKVALSSRDIYLYDTYDIYEESATVDKVFGIGFVNRQSIDNSKIKKLIEIDIFDIFFHYGIIGFIVYFAPILWIYFKSIYEVIRNKLKLDFSKLLYLYAITLLIGISCLAGHIFGAPAVSIYLAFSLVLLNREYEEK